MIPRTFDITYKNDRSMNVTTSEITSFTKIFRSKKAALEAGKPFGWNSVLAINKRFECGWILGIKEQNESVFGIEFDVYRIPKINSNGKNILTVRCSTKQNHI